MTVTRTIVAPGPIADIIGGMGMRAIAARAGATVTADPPSLFHAGVPYLGTHPDGRWMTSEAAEAVVESIRLLARNNGHDDILGFLAYALGTVEVRENGEVVPPSPPLAQPVPLNVMTEYRRLRDAVEEMLDRGMTPGYVDWLTGSVEHLAEIDPGDVELPEIMRAPDPDYDRIGRALYHARKMRDEMWPSDPEISQESYAWANHLTERLAARHEMALERAGLRGSMTPAARRVFDDLEKRRDLIAVATPHVPPVDGLKPGTRDRIAAGVAKHIDPIRLVVVIDGGCFSHALADRPGVELHRVDYDVEGSDSSDICMIPQNGYGPQRGIRAKEMIEIDPALVAEIIAAPSAAGIVEGEEG